MKKQDIIQFQKKLAETRNITIVFHFNPDGDALGSALALYHYFRADDYDVNIVSPNSFPDFLNWMEGSERIIIAQQQPTMACNVIWEADILFIVDMNAPHRAGQELERAIAKTDAFKVLIDHHLQPDIQCDLMYSTPHTSSASELVYNFLYRYLTPGRPFTKSIAEALYVGIITDTGSLSYSCDHPNTYKVLKSLVSSGINGEAIHRKVYDNYKESRIRMLGLALSQRLKVLPDLGASYMYLTLEDLKTNHFQIGDTEGFVNYGLSISGVEYTAFFTEREDRVRVSLRSKGRVDVNHFARQYFNGGGHHNAAGAFFHGTIEEAITHFEDAAHEIALHPDILSQNKDSLAK